MRVCMYGRRSERAAAAQISGARKCRAIVQRRACAGKVGCGGREGTRRGSEAEADGSATRQGVSVRGQCVRVRECVRVCVGRGACLDMDEAESLVSLEFKPPRMRLPCAPIVLSNRTQSYCHTVALPRTEVLAEPEPAPRAHAAYRRWCLDAPATRTLTRMHAPSGTCAGACSVGLVGVGTLAAGVGAAAASARAMPETSLLRSTQQCPLTVVAAAAAAATVFLSRDRRRNETCTQTHAQSCAAPCTLRQCVRSQPSPFPPDSDGRTSSNSG